MLRLLITLVYQQLHHILKINYKLDIGNKSKTMNIYPKFVGGLTQQQNSSSEGRPLYYSASGSLSRRPGGAVAGLGGRPGAAKRPEAEESSKRVADAMKMVKAGIPISVDEREATRSEMDASVEECWRVKRNMMRQAIGPYGQRASAQSLKE